jgi:hypothetical protein
MNMKTNNNIQDKIDKVFNSSETINKTNISPFFKDKTMQLLFAKKQDTRSVVWLWFTPKLQLATLMCFVALNVLAFTKLDTPTYDDNVDDFAETYGLSSDNESITLFN